MVIAQYDVDWTKLTPMKKFFLVLIGTLLLAVLINFIIGPILATQILSARAGKTLQAGPFGLRFDSIQVGRLVPPVIMANKVQLTDELGFIQIEIPSAKFSTEWQWDSEKQRPKVKIKLKIAGLVVKLYQKEGAEEEAPKVKPQSSAPSGPLIPEWLAGLPVKLGFGFELLKGKIDLRNNKDVSLFSLDEFDFSVSSEDLINRLCSVDLETLRPCVEHLLSVSMRIDREHSCARTEIQ